MQQNGTLAYLFLINLAEYWKLHPFASADQISKMSRSDHFYNKREETNSQHLGA